MTSLELLSENFVNANNGLFLQYNGFFKHKNIEGDVWRISVAVCTNYNDKDIVVRMFTQEHGWVHLAKFDEIVGMKCIPYHIHGDEVVDVLKENIEAIERWLDIFH
jgi:hypothetical protein